MNGEYCIMLIVMSTSMFYEIWELFWGVESYRIVDVYKYSPVNVNIDVNVNVDMDLPQCCIFQQAHF